MAVTARYTKPCNTMVDEGLRSQIDAEASRRGVAMAVVVRERLERSYSEHPEGVASVGAAR